MTHSKRHANPPALRAVKRLACLCPAWLPEFVYTVLLRPRPLRRLANCLILKIIPDRVETHGVAIALNTADPVISCALAFGVYETYQTQLVRELIRPGMRVLDIGANVGYYTALFSQAVGARGEVFAFEPEPANFGFLSRTVAANGFTGVRLWNAAVADAPGEASLFLSEDNKGDHRLYGAPEGPGQQAQISVPVVAIDALLTDGSPVDFIKVDVQGAEGLVLRGMRRTIQNSPDVTLLTEFWPEGLRQAGVSPEEFLRTLHDELGLHVWEIDAAQSRLTPVMDFDRLIARHPGRRYTNLLCRRECCALSDFAVPARRAA